MTEVTGSRIVLPHGATGPFRVFANGIELLEGTDFAVVDGVVVLTSARTQRPAENWWRRLVSSTAGIGFYGHGDSIDVHFADAHGRPVVAANVTVEPD